MSLKKHGVAATGKCHLKDAKGNKIYVEGQDGKADKTKPVIAHLYSPGTPQYALAQQMNSNEQLALVKEKGNSEFTPEESRGLMARFLARCTQEIENTDPSEYGGKQGFDLWVAIYEDLEIGFIADQVNKFLGSWGNFTKGSANS
jgi:hypothetical protein